MKPITRALALLLLAGISGCGANKAPTAVMAASAPSTQGSSATWEPPKGLEFLRTVPELRGVTLHMIEHEFLELMTARDVKMQTDCGADQTSYSVSTDSGENVIVMFRDGACSGIQRMQPSTGRST